MNTRVPARLAIALIVPAFLAAFLAIGIVVTAIPLAGLALAVAVSAAMWVAFFRMGRRS